MSPFHPYRAIPPGLPFTTAPALPPGERPPAPPVWSVIQAGWGKESGQPVKSACLSCRAKKAKCDGVQPVCGQCSKKKIECIFIRSKRGGARKKRDLHAPTPLQRFLRRLDKLASVPNLYNIPLSPVPTDNPLDVVREFATREELFKAYYVEVHPYLALMPPRHYMKDVLSTLLPESPFLLACETILALAPHPSDPHPRSIQSKRLRMAKARELNLKTMETVERTTQTGASSLECVQALIILSIYEWGSTGDLEANQRRYGQAMQVAMGMGLHEMDKDTTGGEAQTLEGLDWRKDMMRRTWWFTYMYQLTGAIVGGSRPLIAADDPRVFVDFPICSPNDRTWSNWVQSLRHCSRVLALVNSVVFRNGQTSDGYGTPADPIPTDELARRRSQMLAIDAQIIQMMKEAERLSIIGHVVGREEEVAHNLQIAIRLCLAVTHIHVHRHQAFPEVSFFTKEICGIPRSLSDFPTAWSGISAKLRAKSASMSEQSSVGGPRASLTSVNSGPSPGQGGDQEGGSTTKSQRANSANSENAMESIDAVLANSSLSTLPAHLQQPSTISPKSNSPAPQDNAAINFDTVPGLTNAYMGMYNSQLVNNGIMLNDTLDPKQTVSPGSMAMPAFPSSTGQHPSTGMNVAGLPMTNGFSLPDGFAGYTMGQVGGSGFGANVAMLPNDGTGLFPVDEEGVQHRSSQPHSSFDSAILDGQSGGSFSSVGGSLGGGRTQSGGWARMPSVNETGEFIDLTTMPGDIQTGTGFAPLPMDTDVFGYPKRGSIHHRLPEGYEQTTFQPAPPLPLQQFLPGSSQPGSFSGPSPSSSHPARDSLGQIEVEMDVGQGQLGSGPLVLAQPPPPNPLAPDAPPLNGFHCTGYTSAGITQPGYIADPGYGTAPINSYTNTEANLAAFDLPMDPRGLPTVQYAAYSHYPDYSTTPMGMGLVSTAGRGPAGQTTAAIPNVDNTGASKGAVFNSAETLATATALIAANSGIDPLMYETGLFEPRYIDGHGASDQFPSGDLFAAAVVNPFAYGFPVPPNPDQQFEQQVNVGFGVDETNGFTGQAGSDGFGGTNANATGSSFSGSFPTGTVPAPNAYQLSLNPSGYQGNFKISQTGHVRSPPTARNAIGNSGAGDVPVAGPSNAVHESLPTPPRSSGQFSPQTPQQETGNSAPPPAPAPAAEASSSTQTQFQQNLQNEMQRLAAQYSDYDFIEDMWSPEKFPSYLPQPWFAQPGGAASLVCAPSEMPIHAGCALPTEYPMPTSDMPWLQHPAAFVPDDEPVQTQPPPQLPMQTQSLVQNDMVVDNSMVEAIGPSDPESSPESQLAQAGPPSDPPAATQSAAPEAPALPATAKNLNLDAMPHQAWGIEADGTVKKEEEVTAEYDESSGSGTRRTSAGGASIGGASAGGASAGGVSAGGTSGEDVFDPEQLDDTFPPGISLARCAAAAHTIVRMEIIHRSAAIALNEGPLKWMPFCSCALVSGAFAFLLLALAVQAEKEFDDDNLSEKRGIEVDALFTNVKIIIAALETYGVMWAGIDNMAQEVKAALEAAIALPQEIRGQIQAIADPSPEAGTNPSGSGQSAQM